ncbi:hypothetical protein HII31_06382, partial [Pseudocercospora fuligena]
PNPQFPSSALHNISSNSQRQNKSDEYNSRSQHRNNNHILSNHRTSLSPIQMATLSYTPTTSGRWHSTREERRDTMEAANDLLGVRSSRTSTTTQPSEIRTVEIRGRPYRIPARITKEFYRDLTYYEDDEIIRKYRLEPCKVEDYFGQRTMTERKRSSTIVESSKQIVDSRRHSRRA